MYAVLGDIEFEPLTGFDSLEERLGVDYAEHALIGKKPKLQFVGDKLDEARVSLLFNHTFCEPGAELERLEREMGKHEPLALVMGSGDHKGYFVITDMTIVGKQHSSSGRELAVTVEVVLKQGDDTPRKRQPPGFANGVASGVLSSLLDRVPSQSSKLSAAVAGAKTAIATATKAIDEVRNVQSMLTTNPALAIAHLPVAADKLGVGAPLLNEAGQVLADVAAVTSEVAVEAMAVADGVRVIADSGLALRDMLLDITPNNAPEQATKLGEAALALMSRADQLSAPLATMAVRSAVRRMA